MTTDATPARSRSRSSGPTPGWSTRCTACTARTRTRSRPAGASSSPTTSPAPTSRRLRRGAPAPAAPAPAAPAAPSDGTRPPVTLDGETPQPLRGASARVVENMEASLGVPTATSVRAVPAKLLEVNRQILNNQLARDRGGKVSFTHLIGFAVVRALRTRAEHERELRRRRRHAERRAPRRT